LKLKNLFIKNLPGIRPGFSIDTFQCGVNLIIGSNGIGKSSLIRALKYLIIEPNSKDPKALSLEGVFEDEMGQIEVIRNGSEALWTREGKPITRPVFDPDHLNYYWMSIHSLIHVGHRQNIHLVQCIEQALAGGYDLPALGLKEMFKPKPRAGQEESKKLKRACEDRRNVEAQNDALYAKEQRLEELDEQIERAHQAKVKQDNLDIAIDLSKQIEKIETCESKLDRFPAHMSRLTGRESERLDCLKKQKNRLIEHIKHAEQTLSSSIAQLKRMRCGQLLEQSDLIAVKREEIEMHHKHLNQARLEREKIEQNGETLVEENNRQKMALTLLQKEFAGKIELCPPHLTVEQVERAENFSRKLSMDQQTLCELHAQIAAIDAIKNHSLDEEGKMTQFHNGILALNKWLGSFAMQEKIGEKKMMIAMCATALISLICSLTQKAWALLATSVLSLLGSLNLIVKNTPDVSEQARQEFEHIGLKEKPREWTEQGVRALLGALYEKCDTLREAHRRFQMKTPLLERIKQLEERKQGWEEKRKQLAKGCGFDPTITTLGFDHFIRIVWNYQKTVDAIHHLTAAIQVRSARVKKYHQQVQQFIREWGIDVDLDHDQLSLALHKLSGDLHRAKATCERIHQLTKTLERDKKELVSINEQIDRLYSDVGLIPGDIKTLEESLSQLKKWTDLSQARNDHQVLAQEYQDKLSKRDPQLIEKANETHRRELETEREKCIQLSGEKERYVAAKAGIEKEIEKAEASDQLERATEEQIRQQSKLEQIREEQLFAEAAQFLLKEVQVKHQAEHQIAIIKNVKHFFSQFTCNTWQVEFTRSGLCIKDVKKGAMRSVEELSSGTHVQLFLAIRFAWIKHLEQSNPPLPIFLDEALLTSDEERFGAIAKTLLSLANNEKRQIFYLAARFNEPLHWRKKVNTVPHIIDLDPIRLGDPIALSDV